MHTYKAVGKHKKLVETLMNSVHRNICEMRFSETFFFGQYEFSETYSILVYFYKDMSLKPAHVYFS